MTSILVVEDDEAIRNACRRGLDERGYAVATAATGLGGLELLINTGADVVLLDLGLPDRDGLSIIPQLQAQRSIAVLVVSARDAVDEKVASLDLGAVDFVTKPFDTDELLARLRVALRHHGGSETTRKIVERGQLSIDLDRRLVCRDGAEVHLTRKEHDVLAVLAKHIGRVVTHDRLLDTCWGADEDPRVEYLRIVIRNLRQKLEAPEPVGSIIANELGVGYRLRADP